MKFIHYFIIFTLLFIYNDLLYAKNKNYLISSYELQVKPLKNKYLELSFKEDVNEFYHSFTPWKTMQSNIAGVVWYNAENFLKTDTLSIGTNKYYSQTHFKENMLLYIDYGSNEPSIISRSTYNIELLNTLRYTPSVMLHYFFSHKISVVDELNSEYAVCKTNIDDTQVEVYINKKSYLVTKIATLSNSYLYGDVQDTYHYNNYNNTYNTYYPSNIIIEKLNGKLKDENDLVLISKKDKAPDLIPIPKNYTIKNDTIIKPEISIEKFNDHIYFISLHHSDDKVMLVNFSDFLFVAEAPISSANGELIIAEAKKIAPNKPIKYFAFGHFHDHYIGGVRAFVHKGTEIIHTKNSAEYLSYLVNAKHTIEPDSLQLEPRVLKMKEINDSLIISDGSFSMNIYFIGEQSAHTQDYLMYYFPKEKIVFEDDLVWMVKEGAMKKASKRQAGLYNAIKDRGIKVETIIQSWPLKNYGVKTLIPFVDLEKSVNIE